MKRLFSVFVVALVTGLALSACQTTKHVAASHQETMSQVAGDWTGYFINSKGTRYPLTFTIANADGQISGQANIPSSSHDKNPTLSGQVQGHAVEMKSSSGFTFALHMSKDDKGAYHLSGPVSGPNRGRLEATKVN